MNPFAFQTTYPAKKEARLHRASFLNIVGLYHNRITCPAWTRFAFVI
jgi:hypothetical protein